MPGKRFQGLEIVFHLLRSIAHLHNMVDGEEHRMVRVGVPLCCRRWYLVWKAVAATRLDASRAIYATMRQRYRCCPVYMFEAKIIRVRARWSFLSFQNFSRRGMLVRSTITWPRASREFLQMKPASQFSHLCCCVLQGIDTATFCYEDICGVYRIPTHRLKFNEFEAFIDMALQTQGLEPIR